jgi:hypothetical protein
MLQNPLFRVFQKKEVKQVAPITILCVVNDDSHVEHREVERIRSYCKTSGLGFRIRGYDTDKHDMDMYIKQLPCFHLYYKGGYSETFNLTELPMLKIKERIVEWEEEKKQKERRKQEWENKKRRWKRRWLGIEERPPEVVLPKVMPEMYDDTMNRML